MANKIDLNFTRFLLALIPRDIDVPWFQLVGFPAPPGNRHPPPGVGRRWFSLDGRTPPTNLLEYRQ